jgi:hypothetical protein
MRINLALDIWAPQSLHRSICYAVPVGSSDSAVREVLLKMGVPDLRLLRYVCTLDRSVAVTPHRSPIAPDDGLALWRHLGSPPVLMQAGWVDDKTDEERDLELITVS